MKLYFVAIQFLTIIPLPFQLRWEKNDMARSLTMFPLAGLTIGAILAGLNWLIEPFLSRQLTDALLITALAAVTGALHLDGLADVCDGIAARGSRERFLEIMKDSRVGAVGVVGVVLGLLLKWQAVVALPAGMKWQALLLFPAITRFCQVQMIVFGRNARQDGLGSALVKGASPASFWLAAIQAAALGWLLLGIVGIVLMAAAIIATMLIQQWFTAKIGGITGDIIGCSTELNEILLLILMPVLIRSIQ